MTDTANTDRPEIYELNPAYIEGLMAMPDLSAPQWDYKDRLEEGGFFAPVDGFALSYDRANTEFILRHHEIFTTRVRLDSGNVRPLIPMNVDPPDHSKYRKLLDPLFAPRVMDRWEDDITRRVNSFIDSFIDRGECNFSEEFAEVFPSSVFLGLVGLPEDELQMFLDLRDFILHPERYDPEALTDFTKRMEVNALGGQKIYDLCTTLVEDRRKHPGDDIFTLFVNAEVDGDRLSDEDIQDIFFLLLIAGLDTVRDTLTCFYGFLATHPEHRRQLVAHPDLISQAVEELLRWETPVPGGCPRYVTQDVELPGGQKLSAGSTVQISLGAANVDPNTFEDPYDVRFDREVNPHLAFGGGVHRCLGAHLARRELRITLREWHKRIPEYWIKAGHEDLQYQHSLRHIDNLMLAWR
jgi:cytochrome P450